MLVYRNPAGRSRRGVVLLAVLVVIVVLTLAAYRYNEFTLGEYRAADSSIKSAQARAFAESGVYYTAAMMVDPTNNLNGSPWNNQQSFQGIPVPSTAKNALSGRFTILSLLSPDDLTQNGAGGQSYQYGVSDETGKINLNALLALDNGQGNIASLILMSLPNMTSEISDAIIDWMDADETPRTNGAESSYYQGLNPPYSCKDGPLDSLEELLLVRGVTAQLLFGNDRNRNGVYDKDEDDGTGQVDLGWSGYLTVYSREANVNPTNNTGRVYLNDGNLTTLVQNLQNAGMGQDEITYVMGYRLYGGGSSSGSGSSSSGSSSSSGNAAQAQSAVQTAVASSTAATKTTQIPTLWDLITSKVMVSVTSGNSTQSVALPNPFADTSQQEAVLPILFNSCTTNQSPDISPRINVNTASQTVLNALTQAVTTLQTSDVQNIIGTRPQLLTSATAPDPIFSTPTWLLTRANIKASVLKQLDPYITTYTQVYRIQSIGYFDKEGPVSRVEAVIDTNAGRPRIVYMRDITELGRAFNMSDIKGSTGE